MLWVMCPTRGMDGQRPRLQLCVDSPCFLAMWGTRSLELEDGHARAGAGAGAGDFAYGAYLSLTCCVLRVMLWGSQCPHL